MKKIIEDIFNSEDFISSKENFLSEKDFQFNLARMLELKGCKNIILEYPIDTEKYNNTNVFRGKNAYIDIYCEHEDKKYYMELKYKTKKLITKRHNLETDFELKNHYAHNDNIRLIDKDICRLEKIIQTEEHTSCIGYVLLLTNDNFYHENMNAIIKNRYSVTLEEFNNHAPFEYLLIEITNNKEQM